MLTPQISTQITVFRLCNKFYPSPGCMPVALFDTIESKDKIF